MTIRLGVFIQYLTNPPRSSLTVPTNLGMFWFCCCRMNMAREFELCTLKPSDSTAYLWISSGFAFSAICAWWWGCWIFFSSLAFVNFALLGPSSRGACKFVSWSGALCVLLANAPRAVASTQRNTYPSHSTPFMLQLLHVGRFRSHFLPRRRHVLQAVPNRLFRLISKASWYFSFRITHSKCKSELLKVIAKFQI